MSCIPGDISGEFAISSQKRGTAWAKGVFVRGSLLEFSHSVKGKKESVLNRVCRRSISVTVNVRETVTALKVREKKMPLRRRKRKGDNHLWLDLVSLKGKPCGSLHAKTLLGGVISIKQDQGKREVRKGKMEHIYQVVRY